MKTAVPPSTALLFGRLLCLLWLVGCAAPAGQERIDVQIAVDGGTLTVQVPAGSRVQTALAEAQVQAGALDRVEPSPATVLSAGAQVRVVRVTEQLEVRQEPIPFERRLLRNESLPQDTETILQGGREGLQKVVYRHVLEDGIEQGNSPVAMETRVITPPTPEIRMTGVQAPFVPVSLPGRLVYLEAGNAWLIEGTTGNRQPVITTGDVDGEIFRLSGDGAWLLFTRKAGPEGAINTLWAAAVGAGTEDLVDLGAQNVAAFADWLPGSNRQVLYSTAQPADTVPGWRSNNDLNLLTIFKSRQTMTNAVQLLQDLAGVSPLEKTSFAWNAAGTRLAYANDHSVGVIDAVVNDTVLNTAQFTQTLEFAPFQTDGSWAWVPAIAWSPADPSGGSALFTTAHIAPAGMAVPEESQIFDLQALPAGGGDPIGLVAQAGMFANPLPSPWQGNPAGERSYQVAYLQSIFPTQSETSRCRLVVMDRDGSNRRDIFPPEGAQGIVPQRHWGAWSPAPMPDSGQFALAILYQGNLWLVDTASGAAQPVTTGGQTERVDWK